MKRYNLVLPNTGEICTFMTEFQQDKQIQNKPGVVVRLGSNHDISHLLFELALSLVFGLFLIASDFFT